jgi:hypothetical protein
LLKNSTTPFGAADEQAAIAADFMSRMLQLAFLDFQRFPLARGYSTRHGMRHG